MKFVITLVCIFIFGSIGNYSQVSLDAQFNCQECSTEFEYDDCEEEPKNLAESISVPSPSSKEINTELFNNYQKYSQIHLPIPLPPPENLLS